MANGFPTTLINKDEVIVSKDLLDIFDMKVGEELLLKYEFLSFLPERFDILQSIIFDEELPANLTSLNLTRG